MTRMSTFLRGHWPKSTEGFEIEEVAGWINTIIQETEGTELGPKSICFGSGALILPQLIVSLVVVFLKRMVSDDLVFPLLFLKCLLVISCKGFLI